MAHDDLERRVDGALRALPTPRAPGSLLPRVMAAVAARPALPWYRRGWAQWPRQWQIASVLVFVSTAAGLVLLWPHVSPVVATYHFDLDALIPSWMRSTAVGAGQTAEACRVVWRLLVQPVIGYIVAFVITMFFACVTFGTALDRVALGGPSEL